MPQRECTVVPLDYTNFEATEIWRGTRMSLLMLLCFVLAVAIVGVAWLYSGSMPLAAIMMTTCTIPTFGTTGAYFFLRVRGQQPTWTQVKKVCS